jgi:hypothetical protein
LEPTVVQQIELEVEHLRHLWDRRVGWREKTDPLRFHDRKPYVESRKGRRGLGIDPDDPWFHLAGR